MATMEQATAEAHRHLRQQRPDEALRVIASHVQGAATFTQAHALHLQILLALGRLTEADAAFESARLLRVESPDALDAMGFYARRLDRHELSNEFYKRAAVLAPSDAGIQYNLATSERSLGHLAAAARACERAVELSPTLYSAVLMRSELLKATEMQNNVASLRQMLAADAADDCQMFAGYALGKELHDLEQYDEAFASFEIGASARRRNLSYDVAQDEMKLERIMQVFDRGAVPAPDEEIGDDRPIFIVGLPRSGTTLVERILSGLPDVRSNGETGNFASALLECAPEGPGDVFERCAKAPPLSVARAYQRRATRGGSAGNIIEKLPQNYLYIGAIAAAMPEALILWVRRDPIDNCFAMYRTLFGEGYPFSYSFRELARYYAGYERLMAHWRTLFPDRLVEVNYETLVSAPEATAEWIASSCGLSWTNDALEISRNRTASLTASASQVRGEIYSSSSGLWHRYRDHLKPLLSELNEAGVIVSALD